MFRKVYTEQGQLIEKLGLCVCVYALPAALTHTFNPSIQEAGACEFLSLRLIITKKRTRGQKRGQRDLRAKGELGKQPAGRPSVVSSKDRNGKRKGILHSIFKFYFKQRRT